MRAPRVKPEHQPHRRDNGTIRIGGQAIGLAGEIEDPDGSVWTLLQTMDGTRSVDEIIAIVTQEHPNFPADDVRRGIDELIAAGYVEDAQVPTSDELTAQERERYDRSHRYFRAVDTTPRDDPWYAQLTLKKSAVTVIGVGSTGSAAAMCLTQAGVGKLHLVDFDMVELSNLNRQILFTEADIGKPKVDVAIKRLRATNSDVAITGERRRMDGADDITAVTEGATVVALCADQPAGLREWANAAFLANETPWVEGGYAGPQIITSVFTPGYGGCYMCKKAYEEAMFPQPIEGETTPPSTNQPGPVFPPSAQISGSLIANAVIAAITGIPRLPRSYSFEFNLSHLENATELSTYPRWPTCPACGISVTL